MPQTRVMYIELKTGYEDNGPAWIGRVKFSQSGKTVYFNGKALSRIGGRGIQGNHQDFETSEEYWVSGVKKDGSDRHWAGSGKIKIDAEVVSEYLTIVGVARLDTSRFEVCTAIVETVIEHFHEIENRKLYARSHRHGQSHRVKGDGPILFRRRCRHLGLPRGKRKRLLTAVLMD